MQANGKENLENYIQIALKARENKTEFPFIVFDKKSGKYAGSTRFYDINLAFKTLRRCFTKPHAHFLVVLFAETVLF